MKEVCCPFCESKSIDWKKLKCKKCKRSLIVKKLKEEKILKVN